MGNSPSTQDPSHSSKRNHGYHLHEAFNKDRQGSITSQLFNNKKSVHKRHTSHASSHKAAIPHRMQLLASHDVASDCDSSVNNDTIIDKEPSPLFKKDYSLANAADENDTTLANLSLNDDHDGSAPEEQVKSPSFLSPGPSMATVKQTKSDLDDLSTVNCTVVDETMENERSGHPHHERHRSSIIALKKTLMENSATASPSPTRSSSVHSASLPPLTKTGSIDIPVKQTYSKKPSVHAYQYQYLSPDPTFSGNSHTGKEANGDNIDAEAGVLQSEDMVLNQSLLQNALKKDMQRLSRANSSNSTYTMGRENRINNSESNIDGKENSIDPSDDSTVPISATAKMMMKLYGDKTLMERDLNKHQNKTKKAQNKKLRSASNSRRSSFASLHSLQSKKSILTNGLNLQPLHPLHPIINDNESQYSAPQHREISHHSNSISSMSSISSTNSTENTLVVLKWKSDTNMTATTEVSIVSNDIASALKEQREVNLDDDASLDSEKPLNSRIRMIYDSVHREWFVPDLFLPAGIYRLQFSINGLLTHSNFLPTATDSEGNFVNWFEVLPGYHTIEPFRDEADMDFQMRSTLDEEAPIRPEPKRLSSSRKSSYYSAKDGERPGTPFSDYRGLSRSNSVFLRGSFVRLKASSLDLMAEIKPEKLEYSNEIPNLFNIGEASTTTSKDHFERLSPQDRPSFTHKVVDCNQDDLFATLQQGGNIDAETAEAVFLSRYPIPDLPIYLNSSYLNRILNQSNPNSEFHDGDEGGINHIIPHVNLNHLLTSSIRDEIISVACTTRYEGKFITQVIYAPCYYKTQKAGGNN
ncbi:Sip1p SKDI_04G6290 [Saccharomyces kudriavzevii IFO 1802]|uniref:Association with the SNF1 complex (ASC) domain-containing protein n=1 Tax=Saccharomyces kudriavzevii (strain ATCC MYA-4449 / AS 2.2408 / CBS 8840 / NBRC 1802 / NCYC 2889) TaxID=226230 RepID=A0AA35NP80_SACK1|nr:uncharacterized protein SKDI_04G6290 [Saccharomyces kudriavzevii IFO 1802]CAI4059240.1 hypothetical protein SKDI_04G6290 [Saccharomyces kudriavzevii IFO 1802]